MRKIHLTEDLAELENEMWNQRNAEKAKRQQRRERRRDPYADDEDYGWN